MKSISRIKTIFCLIVILGFSNTQLFSQSFEKVDSLVNKMCETVIVITSQNDSLDKNTLLTDVIKELQEKHINQYLAEIPYNEIDTSLMIIELRLEKLCEEYGKIRHEQSENKGDWVRHTVKPVRRISNEGCGDFFPIQQYSYLEANGDRVELEIRNGYWIDHFKDGTTSKLKLSMDEDCGFTIEFIESNNEMRKSFSKKGDKYKYMILASEDGYFVMSVEIPEQSIYYTFNMYYEK